MRIAKLLIGALALSLAPISCEQVERIGYTNRVLHRIPSPDGRMFAVCQERPEFDGPGYGVFLENPDGSFLRGLYEIGDGDPCSEMAWSPDGRTLAVLSGHGARVMFVDVAWALDQPDVETSHHSWTSRQGDPPRAHFVARDLRFFTADMVEYRECLDGVAGTPQCSATRRLAVPDPIFDEARHRTARRK